MVEVFLWECSAVCGAEMIREYAEADLAAETNVKLPVYPQSIDPGLEMVFRRKAGAGCLEGIGDLGFGCAFEPVRIQLVHDQWDENISMKGKHYRVELDQIVVEPLGAVGAEKGVFVDRDDEAVLTDVQPHEPRRRVLGVIIFKMFIGNSNSTRTELSYKIAGCCVSV